MATVPGKLEMTEKRIRAAATLTIAALGTVRMSEAGG